MTSNANNFQWHKKSNENSGKIALCSISMFIMVLQGDFSFVGRINQLIDSGWSDNPWYSVSPTNIQLGLRPRIFLSRLNIIRGYPTIRLSVKGGGQKMQKSDFFSVSTPQKGVQFLTFLTFSWQFYIFLTVFGPNSWHFPYISHMPREVSLMIIMANIHHYGWRVFLIKILIAFCGQISPWLKKIDGWIDGLMDFWF